MRRVCLALFLACSLIAPLAADIPPGPPPKQPEVAPAEPEEDPADEADDVKSAAEKTAAEKTADVKSAAEKTAAAKTAAKTAKKSGGMCSLESEGESQLPGLLILGLAALGCARLRVGR